MKKCVEILGVKEEWNKVASLNVLNLIKFHSTIFLLLQRRNPILEKVIHSLADLFQFLDSKTKNLAKNSFQMKAVF